MKTSSAAAVVAAARTTRRGSGNREADHGERQATTSSRSNIIDNLRRPPFWHDRLKTHPWELRLPNAETQLVQKPNYPSQNEGPPHL